MSELSLLLPAPRAVLRAGIIGALLALTLLAGCSALRMGYAQGPTLAHWWLDSYLDFDPAQSLRARESLDQWFAWHRRAELPQLAALLDRAATEVAADAGTTQACRWLDDLQARIDVAAEQALPGAAAMAARLRPEQLEHLRQRQARSNREFRDDFLQPDPKRRAKASLERAVERAEMVYGRLDTGQRQQLAQTIAASPFDPERWLAERQHRQRDLLQTLQQIQSAEPGRADAQGLLRAYWQRLRQSPDEAYRRYARELADFNCTQAARLHNQTTPAQRERAQKRLRGWEEDLRALAAAATAAPAAAPASP